MKKIEFIFNQLIYDFDPCAKTFIHEDRLVFVFSLKKIRISSMYLKIKWTMGQSWRLLNKCDWTWRQLIVYLELSHFLSCQLNSSNELIWTNQNYKTETHTHAHVHLYIYCIHSPMLILQFKSIPIATIYVRKFSFIESNNNNQKIKQRCKEKKEKQNTI